jgi:hypothetical protein
VRIRRLVQNGRMTSSRSRGFTRAGAKLTARATGSAMTRQIAVASSEIHKVFQKIWR